MAKSQRARNRRATDRVDNVTFVDFKKLQQEETSQQFKNIPKRNDAPRRGAPAKNAPDAAFRHRASASRAAYFEPPVAPAVPLFERRQAVHTWVEDFVDNSADSGRLKRARGYVAEGRVHYLSVEDGIIAASVQGSQLDPFSVSIIFPQRNRKQLQALEEATRIAIEEQQAGNYTFRRSSLQLLFFQDTERVRFDCDCPDKVHFCKHVAATLLVFAARVKADPAVAFQLRDLDFQRLIEFVRPQAAVDPDTAPATATYMHGNPRWEQDFWEGGTLPEIPEVAGVDFFRKADEAYLRRALKSVSTSPVEQVRAFADLEEIYHHLEQLALKRFDATHPQPSVVED